MNEKEVSIALTDLADCEDDMEKAEDEVQTYRLNHLKGIYERRDKIIQKIPSFWKIVLSQHDDFANYIRAADFRYVDAIDSVIVDWTTLNDYSIIIRFRGIKDELKPQTIKKHFVYKNDQLRSEAVDVISPASKSEDSSLRSLFDWFKWTGSSNIKEFANGGDFASLISEDIYPYCVKYYTEAQRDIQDEESCSDSSEGELEITED